MWGHLGGGQAYGIDGDMWHRWRHVAGCGGMWQDVGAFGRVLVHVAGGGGLSQGIGAYGGGRGGDMWQGLGHVAGCGDMWQGVMACGRVFTHVAGYRIGHVAEGGGM